MGVNTLLVGLLDRMFSFYPIGVGFVGMLPLRTSGFPLVSVLYGVFLGVMLLLVLRKHLCTNCYYYGKRCSTGWGKLSSLMFEKGSGDYGFGVKLAGVTWVLTTLIPIVGILATLILSFSVFRVGILMVFLFLTTINYFFIEKHVLNVR